MVQVLLRDRRSILRCGQRVEALRGRERHEVDLVGVAEHGGGDRPAEIDVEAVPGAVGVLVGEAGQPLADAAAERCRPAHVVERAGRRALRRDLPAAPDRQGAGRR